MCRDTNNFYCGIWIQFGQTGFIQESLGNTERLTAKELENVEALLASAYAFYLAYSVPPLKIVSLPQARDSFIARFFIDIFFPLGFTY